MWRGGYASLLASSALVAAALSGCSLKDSGADLANGKQQFAEKCGTCHTLARANSKGVEGPNLDEAFARSRADGMPSSTFQGVVERQILNPNINDQIDPQTGKVLPSMPPKIVTGDDARDVAAYVAQAVAVPGKDTGRLAQVGAQEAKGTAKAQNGTLDIPVAAAGLSYQYKDAEASAGQVTIVSKNPQTQDHNIAIDGNGVDQKGPVVKGGADSKISLNLKPGTYSFYCSVDGHRQAGMEGKLTVK
jgi:plastocyanin